MANMYVVDEHPSLEVGNIGARLIGAAEQMKRLTHATEVCGLTALNAEFRAYEEFLRKEGAALQKHSAQLVRELIQK